MVFAACSKDEPPPPPPPRTADAAVTADAAAVAAPTDAASSAGKITISVAKPRTPGTGFAKRCAIAGAPLVSASCSGGSEGVAIDRAGIVHVVNDQQLHRYKLGGDPCTLEPIDTLELPPENPRPQPLGKGPVYMRSGGAAWKLAQTPDAIYVHDFLGGLFRVGAKKIEPACTDVFGFKSIGKLGKRLLVKRNGIEQLVLGKKCTAKSAGIADRSDDIYVANDRLYAGFSKLVRYDKATPVALASGTRLCAITAITACGDGACVLDHNCPKLVQLAADDTVLREIDDADLFDVRPYSVDDAVTAPDGSVLIYARHRDRVGGKDTCEAAIYRVPPAVFAH